MFKNKKEIQKLEKLKEELLFITNNLETTTPKIDISNVYIWEENGLYSIVKLNIENIRGATWNGLGRVKDGYKSTLTDIFTNQIIYTKKSVNLISQEQWIMSSDENTPGHFAYLFPIYKLEPDILAYADKQVPLYALQQLYYKLNNVNLNNKILKKTT